MLLQAIREDVGPIHFEFESDSGNSYSFPEEAVLYASYSNCAAELARSSFAQVHVAQRAEIMRELSALGEFFLNDSQLVEKVSPFVSASMESVTSLAKSIVSTPAKYSPPSPAGSEKRPAREVTQEETPAEVKKPARKRDRSRSK